MAEVEVARHPPHTPRGVKKSKPRLSASGRHRRTMYSKGGLEAELVEKLKPTGCSVREARCINKPIGANAMI